jgi:hypothetical protein
MSFWMLARAHRLRDISIRLDCSAHSVRLLSVRTKSTFNRPEGLHFFRIHIVLALLSFRWKWVDEPLRAFSIALLVLCTVLFANAYQIT